MDVTSQEKSLIEYMREFGYGDITVIIQNGQPIRIERIKESIKLS